MKLVNFYRKPISIVVMVTFTILLCFWANQSPAAPATAAAEKSSGASMEKGTGDGTGFIEQEESEPVVKKGKKFPWLIVGAVVIIGAAAVYFLVLNKKYTLTVNLGEGCTGTPAATTKFKKNKAVAYNFTAQSGWGNLLVKLDGAVVAASGTVTMDKDHSLDVTATHGAVVNITSTPAGAKIFDNGADTGKVTPALINYPTDGNHVYLLRQCGYKDYSKTQGVVVGQTYDINAALVAGILDDFLISSPCWVPKSASDWTTGRSIYKCSSTLTGNWQFNYYNTAFNSTHYTVEAKMKRSKGEVFSSNSIILSTTTNMSSVNGYLFNYTANGQWSIWKLHPYNFVAGTGPWIAIRTWKPSGRINSNLDAWNTIKIRRSGANYSFYINNSLITTVNDSSPLDPRIAVLAFYSFTAPQTELQYDYVHLDLGAAAQDLMPAETEAAVMPDPSQSPCGHR